MASHCCSLSVKKYCKSERKAGRRRSSQGRKQERGVIMLPLGSAGLMLQLSVSAHVGQAGEQEDET